MNGLRCNQKIARRLKIFEYSHTDKYCIFKICLVTKPVETRKICMPGGSFRIHHISDLLSLTAIPTEKQPKQIPFSMPFTSGNVVT